MPSERAATVAVAQRDRELYWDVVEALARSLRLWEVALEPDTVVNNPKVRSFALRRARREMKCVRRALSGYDWYRYTAWGILGFIAGLVACQYGLGN
jgi:hypothetical protein